MVLLLIDFNGYLDYENSDSTNGVMADEATEVKL